MNNRLVVRRSTRARPQDQSKSIPSKHMFLRYDPYTKITTCLRRSNYCCKGRYKLIPLAPRLSRVIVAMQSGTGSIGRKKYCFKNILDALFSTVGTERVLAGSGRQVYGNGSVSRRWVVQLSKDGRQTDGGWKGRVAELVWWIFVSILGTKMGTAVTKTSIFGSQTLPLIVIRCWFVSLLMKEKVQHVFGFLEAW
jgi:hypothetical protein